MVRRTTRAGERLDQLEADVSSLPEQERLEQLEAVVCSLPSMQDVETRLSQVQRGPRYVRWTRSIKHHIVASGHPLDPPHWHKTRCGRYFGTGADVVRSDEPPPNTERCGDCYPEAREENRRLRGARAV